MYRVFVAVSGEPLACPVEFRHAWDAEGLVASMRHRGFDAWLESTRLERLVDAVLIRVALRVLRRKSLIPRALRSRAENFEYSYAIKGMI
jgi:hypothetical protein